MIYPLAPANALQSLAHSHRVARVLHAHVARKRGTQPDFIDARGEFVPSRGDLGRDRANYRHARALGPTTTVCRALQSSQPFAPLSILVRL